LHVDPSPNAVEAGFKGLSKRQIICAATSDGKYPTTWSLLTPIQLFNDANTFPAPLVLPNDDLDIDPEWPPQSVKEWRHEEERNSITRARKTIYLVAPPEITDEMSPMRDWTNSNSSAKSNHGGITNKCELKASDFVDYIASFYYGMRIKMLNKKFAWQAWEHETAPGQPPKPKYDGKLLKSNQTKLIGLRTPQNAVIGIRCRLSPDKVMQVNLDDVLEALAENVPKDAYAIIMLLNLDMYEGDDEIFTGGRAYGGSRIAVVSSFRDHPQRSSPDPQHRWPASHCASYASSKCGVQELSGNAPPCGAMGAAIHAVADLPTGKATRDMYAEWFSRVAQTVVHELGHCLGLDHCTYYACVMQGSASTAEALRQPGYVCPVCLEKVAWGIGPVFKGWRDDGVRRAYVMERYEAMKKVCERWTRESRSVYWVGYGVWLDEVIKRQAVEST
jgi:archaemetzincin